MTERLEKLMEALQEKKENFIWRQIKDIIAITGRFDAKEWILLQMPLESDKEVFDRGINIKYPQKAYLEKKPLNEQFEFITDSFDIDCGLMICGCDDCEAKEPEAELKLEFTANREKVLRAFDDLTAYEFGKTSTLKIILELVEDD